MLTDDAIVKLLEEGADRVPRIAVDTALIISQGRRHRRARRGLAVTGGLAAVVLGAFIVLPGDAHEVVWPGDKAPQLVDSGAPTGALPDAPTPAAGEAPTFTGPFAATYTQFYNDTSSDLVRGVLADEEVTDAEYAAMTDRFAACLADHGITFGGFDQDAGFTTSIAPDGGDTHALVSGCSASSGEQWIGALYTFAHQAPEGPDAAPSP